MQLMIDTSLETPRALRVYAEMLQMLAKLASDELADAGTPQQGLFSDSSVRVPPLPLPPSNIIPFVQPAPPPATAPTSAPSVAPAAGVAPAAPSAASAPVGCDSTGIPWDARIHSSGDNKLNSDGTWRQKRGVNPLLVASVTRELHARVPPPPVAAAPVSLPLPVPPPPVVLPDGPSPGPVATLPASLPLPPSPAAGTVPAGPTFTQLITQANRYNGEGRYDMERLTAAVQKAGGTGLESLAGNPAMIAATWNIMEESVRA